MASTTTRGSFSTSSPFPTILRSALSLSPPLSIGLTEIWLVDRRVSLVVSGQVYFGQIPEDNWYQPGWINETKATEERQKMESENVIYGGSVSSVPPSPFIPVVRLTRIYLDIAICAASILGYCFRVLYSFRPPLTRTSLLSSSIATHCSKTPGTTGVSSMLSYLPFISGPV
jgi:hypothetical protein